MKGKVKLASCWDITKIGLLKCKRCGRILHVMWDVDDDVWNAFRSRTGWKKEDTICLECFAELCGFVNLGKIDRNKVYFKVLWD